MAEIPWSLLASIPAGQRTNNIAHTSLPAHVACATKQHEECWQQRQQAPELWVSLHRDGQGVIPAGPAGPPGATGEAELWVLGADPALPWGTAQPQHAPPGMPQSWGEQSARVWQQLLAWPHQESISFLVYSESYSEFTVWD